jgi:aspartyl/asparaginyl beta-hydroxylase (cupin superfamily)
MGPNAAIKPHHGWADVANGFLRCHYGLVIPEDLSGVWVEGDVQFHKTGEMIVFDDSKSHSGFNRSDLIRSVLIIDIDRPSWVPRGNSPQQMTAKLIDLVDTFS